MKNTLKFMSILAVAVVVVLVVILIQPTPTPQPPASTENLKRFSSLDELKNFLKEKSESYQGYRDYYAEGVMKTTAAPVQAGLSAEMSAEATAEDYSQTNIQVQGVDEPDTVKNDGKYIYTISGNKVVIVNAYPAENMKILSEININRSISQIFINKDKLIIFASGYDYIPYDSVKCLGMGEGIKCGGYSDYRTLVYIYDVSDREAPALERNISVQGNYVDSRMINDYVYVISSKYIDMREPVLPVYSINGVEKTVAIEDLSYFDYEDSSYVFTTIAAINTQEDEFESKVYLTGYTGTVYVSLDNIYLTYTKTLSRTSYMKELINEVYIPLLPDAEKDEVQNIMDSDKSDYEKIKEAQTIVYSYSISLTGKEKEDFDKKLMEELENFEVKIQKQYERTAVHKINIDEADINYIGVGEVPGQVLNQFSMDEYAGYFRIATTTGHVSRTGESTSLNHLYVLDENLKQVGSVEDLAKGERIYSARFLGERAYMVTFKKIDPLFVIDLSNPEAPEVLGYLKITGYSDYLHPYDENHVIGIGKETKGGDEHFSWYQGLKISLFDVSDVANPIEKAKFEIGDRGTESYALQDHKAFLFDKKRNLLVLPISLAEINESRYSGEIPDNAYGDFVWQGAYVLNINLDEITLRGRITHSNETIDTETEKRYWYRDYGSEITRSLYMDDVLYTISQSKIKANDLQSLNEISSVNLPLKVKYYPDYETFGV